MQTLDHRSTRDLSVTKKVKVAPEWAVGAHRGIGIKVIFSLYMNNGLPRGAIEDKSSGGSSIQLKGLGGGWGGGGGEGCSKKEGGSEESRRATPRRPPFFSNKATPPRAGGGGEAS